MLAAAVCGAWVAGVTIASERSASSMANAANKFLASLTPEQKQQATFAFDSEELTRWHYVPAQQFPRNGLPIRAMNETQRGLAHDLMKTGLSQRGYTQAATIMTDLENILKAMGDAPAMRDPEQYRLLSLRHAGRKGVWGWRVEGHHVSLHFNVVEWHDRRQRADVLRSNPAEVRDGPKKGLRILGAEEDAARALLKSLDAHAAHDGDHRRDRARRHRDEEPREDRSAVAGGLSAAAMTPAQRELLMKLLDVYTGMMAADIAADRLARMLKAGLDKIAFAWAGETERGKKHYYRVQGPTFLIEYDNTQNDGNHIHSVWRDFNGDFGRDLLREHVQSVKHD